MKRSILGLGICLALTGCQKNEKTLAAEPERYFDYPAYFNSEIAQIKKDSLLKISADTDTSLTTKVSRDQFVKSIEFLDKLDINRAAWIGKFNVDSINTEDGLTIRYKSLDEAVPLKILETHYYKGQDAAFKVNITKETESPLSSFKQEIKYSRETKSLEIYNQQQKKLGKDPTNFIRLVYSW